MFQIAMIEDEEHTKQEVERLISREFEKLKVQDITTEIYKTAEEFLEVKKHYDVVISDGSHVRKWNTLLREICV